MNHDFHSEKFRMRQTAEKDGFYREGCAAVFCPNCSGSGRYFYTETGVNRCRVCGGSGLTNAEQGCIRTSPEN